MTEQSESKAFGPDEFYYSGAVGQLLEELPILTHAHVKPYLIAILLHRGAVTPQEAAIAITPHCSSIDLKVGAWDYDYCDEDSNRLETLINEVLGGMVGEGIVYYNEEKYVLTQGQNSKNIPKIINWAASTGGQMPNHLFVDKNAHTQVWGNQV